MVPGRFHTVGCVVPENSAHSGEVPTMQASVLSPFRLLPTRVNPCRLLTTFQCGPSTEFGLPLTWLRRCASGSSTCLVK